MVEAMRRVLGPLGLWALLPLSLLWGLPARVAADAPITVGILESLPPFQSWPIGGQPQGLDVDVLDEVAARSGLVFRYERFRDFPALQAALLAGQVRVLTSIAQTPDRSRSMRFTPPYATVQQGFVGRAEVTSVPQTPDLAGRRLALVRGFVTEATAAERYPMAARPAYATMDDAVSAVERGDADFALEALPALRATLAARPQTPLAVLRTFGLPQGQLRLATALRDTELARALANALEQIPPERLQQLRSRWLAAEVPRASAGAAGPAVAPLRVGYFPNDRPFTIEVPGAPPEGLGVEMMRAVARRAGIEIAEFVPLQLAPGLAALSAGRIDVMLGLTDTAERRATMAFVGPYRNNPLVLISRQQYSVWDLGQLSRQRLALLDGFFGASYVRTLHPEIDLVFCPTFDRCLDMVERGEAQAALYGLHGVYERLQARGSRQLQITGTVVGLFDEQNLGLALARQDIAVRLRDALNVAMAEDMPAIERAWAEREARPRVDWARLRWIAAGAAALGLGGAAALWLHLRRLRREIARTDAAREESEQYLAFMAHEVRNSLQSVSGAVALLRGSARPDGEAGERQQSLLEALGSTARGTLGLLNGLLDRHRLQRGQLALTMRPESLEATLRSVVEETRPAALAKGLALRFEPRTPLAGWFLIDALRLQQVLRNLLVNAVKFSDRGEIRLVAELGAAGADGQRPLRLHVRDEGPGLSAEAQARLFQRYATAGGDRPGSGLGLALARELARAMGGELSAGANPEGRGACFSLALPLRAAGGHDDGGAPGALRRLLVVEDSPVYGLLLQQAFENQGVTTVLADSLATAQAALVRSVAGAGDTTPAFDLVLSDGFLGDGSVDDLLRFMREAVRPGVAMPPLVAMSAEVTPADRSRLLGAGAVEAMLKDSDVASFAARVLHDERLRAEGAVAGSPAGERSAAPAQSAPASGVR
jgi:signal transduction histidine kinase